MPRSIFGYVLTASGIHQAALAGLSIAVFLLSAVPLELQRRIINGLTGNSVFASIAELAILYALVALFEQVLKLALNVYRGWVAERTVRQLRMSVAHGELDPALLTSSQTAAGLEIALILEEAEPIGGFVALSISEPLLQGGILVSVVCYLFYLKPTLALLGLAFFIPQTIIVPLVQRAINRRAAARIIEKRGVSSAIADGQANAAVERRAIDRVFRLNMGIYCLKYLMNLAMNLMHHLSVAVALCVGGWLALHGRTDVGTVVAVVGGLAKLNDPWGDLVNWAREFSVVSVKYRLFADAAGWLTGAETPATEASILRSA